MRVAIIIFVLAISIVSGCSQQLPLQPVTPQPVTQPPSSVQSVNDSQAQQTIEIMMPEDGGHSVVVANNQFAFNLYSELKDEEGNIFFSPYSISNALAVAYEGAEGKTADEIQSVFHFPMDPEVRRQAFASINNNLNANHPGYTLSSANALWVQNDYPILENYTRVVLNYYGGHATNLDFIKKTTESRQIINSWVEEQTNGKIVNLIQSLSTQTRMVITNAIYFKGTWLKKFDPEQNVEKNFWKTPSIANKAQMMRLSDEFNYAETSDLQVLELPYDGKKLSMLILLPSKDLDELEESISAEKLEELRGLLQEQKVNVILPKFRFEKRYQLVDQLSQLGMSTAFSMDADFSGIDGTEKLAIAQVVHQAFVEVNEEGTEAAAATGVTMAITSAPIIPTFNADRPFIFIIQDKENGNILFLGRISDPIVTAKTYL